MSAFVTGFSRRNKQEWHITTLARIAEAILTPERPASAGHDSSSRQEGQKMSEADLKQEAEQRLGTEIESSEWDVNKMLECYKIMCERSSRADDARHWRVLENLYIAENYTTAEEIAKQEKIDRRTVYRDVDICAADMTALLFGIGGIDRF